MRPPAHPVASSSMVSEDSARSSRDRHSPWHFFLHGPDARLLRPHRLQPDVSVAAELRESRYEPSPIEKKAGWTARFALPDFGAPDVDTTLLVGSDRAGGLIYQGLARLPHSSIATLAGTGRP